ncbi:MAG: tetratricopeptide repeat protein [Myxococcota bacterium]
MTRRMLGRTIGIVFFATLVFALVGVAGSASAQAKYQFGERTIKKAAKAVEFMSAGDFASAKTELAKINLKRAKPYGRARVHSWLGQIAAQEEDFETSLFHFEKSIEEEALPPEETLRGLFQVGQLQTMLGKYDEAIVTLEKWIGSVETPAPSSYYTLAVTYYQAERPADAVAPAKKAVELSDDPREAWYRLLLSLHLEREEYDEALAILDDIILKYPNKAYWTQLAAIYSQKDMTNKSLAVQQLAKDEGYVTEDRDLTRLAQTFMVEGLPHRGAAIMKKGLEDGTIEPTKLAYQTYSDTLLQSREWAAATDPLGKAAELHKDGSLFVRLAQVNLQVGDWAAARGALTRAFEKGGLTDEGQANILFGIAAANDKRWSEALSAFGRAQRFDGSRETAGKWMAYVEREKARLGVQ